MGINKFKLIIINIVVLSLIGCIGFRNPRQDYLDRANEYDKNGFKMTAERMRQESKEYPESATYIDLTGLTSQEENKRKEIKSLKTDQYGVHISTYNKHRGYKNP